MARLTVCVPTYNRTSLLRQCLTSLLAQTVTDFDIIVVDNASDEDTASVVRELDTPRVRMVRNAQNLGSRGNWNRCLELATTEYVAMCHDDDVYEPAFIEENLRFLDAHPSVGFVHCDAVLTDPSGIPFGRFRAYSSDRVLPARDVFVRYLLHSHDVVLSSVVARRQAYTAAGSFRTEFLCADYDMWLRLAARFDVGYISRPLLRYRTHPSSTSQSMEASRWHREHRAIVDDAFALGVERFGDFGVTREAARAAVDRRWVRRYLREALSRLSRGEVVRAREYLDATAGLAQPPHLAAARRGLRVVAHPSVGRVLAVIRAVRAALRRPAPARQVGPAAIYISYDGALEPLGASQILPYVHGLAHGGVAFVLVTFEKPADLLRTADVARLRSELGAAGIRWVPLRYHKRPSVPATVWDILCGAVIATRLARQARVSVVHARSYVAGVMGLAVRRFAGARFLFDMRGFWPEERVDGGVWPASGALFRAAKRVELALLRRADGVVVLTERAAAILTGAPYRDALRPGTPVTVIPCCVDIVRFARTGPVARADGGRTLVYAGSVGTWYMLEEMLDFVRAIRARELDVRLLVLNRDEHDAIRRAAGARGLADVEVRSATADEMPRELARAWAGLYFIKPVFSKLGASPTKLGEYLAAGLPVIVNAGVGDADGLVAAARVGVVVQRFEEAEYLAKWRELVALVGEDTGLRDRCRATARDRLGLEYGVARYRALYGAVLGPPRTAAHGTGLSATRTGAR